MNDEERLEKILEKARRELGGIDEDTYRRWLDVLESRQTEFGYDGEGRLKVAVFDARSYEEDCFREASGKTGDKCAFTFFRMRLNRNTAHACQGFKVVCVFVQDDVDADTVKILAENGVRFIALRCAGFNNVDLETCKEYGIEAARVPAYSPYAVAEYAVSLMMMLNRKLHMADDRVRSGNFTIEGLVGFDMRGKTVGILGTGKIGRCTIDILLGFGCKVLAFDKFKNEELARRDGVTYVEPQELAAKSDIISLHLPLLPDTHHIIGAKAIEKMKPGVMLINTSRGALIDTKALIAGLKSGKIGAAGLDVYEEEEGVFFEDFSSYETVIQDDVLARLCTFNNVIVTSHQAFLTKEALTNIADTTVENILEFEDGKRGKELTNLVSTD